jgi:predicted Zn-dependent peptidase
MFNRTEQSPLAMAVRGLPLEHPDRYALDLLSVLFGEGMSSRLFMELRERQGLCYDVHAYVSHFLDTGSFGVYAAVDPARGRDAVEARRRVGKLRTRPRRGTAQGQGGW